MVHNFLRGTIQLYKGGETKNRWMGNWAWGSGAQQHQKRSWWVGKLSTTKPWLCTLKHLLSNLFHDWPVLYFFKTWKIQLFFSFYVQNFINWKSFPLILRKKSSTQFDLQMFIYFKTLLQHLGSVSRDIKSFFSFCSPREDWSWNAFLSFSTVHRCPTHYVPHYHSPHAAVAASRVNSW